ncbi:hypothetical protein ACFE04_022165 [Oxalis oulophora]
MSMLKSEIKIEVLCDDPQSHRAQMKYELMPLGCIATLCVNQLQVDAISLYSSSRILISCFFTTFPYIPLAIFIPRRRLKRSRGDVAVISLVAAVVIGLVMQPCLKYVEKKRWLKFSANSELLELPYV